MDLQLILILNMVYTGFFAGLYIMFGTNTQTRLFGALALIIFMLTGAYMLTT